MDTRFPIKQTAVCYRDGATSSEAQVRSGVPQGSVLGPLLLIINKSEISNEITNSTLSCFADDTRNLLGIIKGCRRHPDVQNDL